MARYYRATYENLVPPLVPYVRSDDFVEGSDSDEWVMDTGQWTKTSLRIIKPSSQYGFVFSNNQFLNNDMTGGFILPSVKMTITDGVTTKNTGDEARVFSEVHTVEYTGNRPDTLASFITKEPLRLRDPSSDQVSGIYGKFNGANHSPHYSQSGSPSEEEKTNLIARLADLVLDFNNTTEHFCIYTSNPTFKIEDVFFTPMLGVEQPNFIMPVIKLNTQSRYDINTGVKITQYQWVFKLPISSKEPRYDLYNGRSVVDHYDDFYVTTQGSIYHPGTLDYLERLELNDTDDRYSNYTYLSMCIPNPEDLNRPFEILRVVVYSYRYPLLNTSFNERF